MSTLLLSLRRSTINVENVGVRLWQSSAICLRAERPQCFFIYWIATLCSRCEVKRSADRINTRIRTGRNAPERHTHESRVNHPGLRPPLQWRGTGYVPLRGKVPLCGGLYFIPLRKRTCIDMCRWRLYTIHPLGRTLCTNRLGWSQDNWWLCRRTYSPMGMKCSQCPCVPPQQQRIQTGMTWTVRRQLRTPAQLPGLKQLSFSTSPPLVRK